MERERVYEVESGRKVTSPLRASLRGKDFEGVGASTAGVAPFWTTACRFSIQRTRL